jgi:signal transduction histidine kinase
MSNAIRHGEPARVDIAIEHDETSGIRVEVRDDGIGMPPDGIAGGAAAQLGLIGMRERVMAMTGSLTIQPGYTGKGLVLVARLPCVSSLQPPDRGTPE